MCSKKTTSSNHLTADLPSKKFIFQKEHQEVVIVSWHWSHAKESMNRVSHAHLSSAVITVALVQLLLLRSVFLTFLFLAHCHVIGVQLVRQSDCSKKHLREKKKKKKGSRFELGRVRNIRHATWPKPSVFFHSSVTVASKVERNFASPRVLQNNKQH